MEADAIVERVGCTVCEQTMIRTLACRRPTPSARFRWRKGEPIDNSPSTPNRLRAQSALAFRTYVLTDHR